MTNRENLSYKELSALHLALRHEAQSYFNLFLQSGQKDFWKERINILYRLFKKLLIYGVEDEEIENMHKYVNSYQEDKEVKKDEVKQSD